MRIAHPYTFKLDHQGQHCCPTCEQLLLSTEGGEYCPRLHYWRGVFPSPTWGELFRSQGLPYGTDWELRQKPEQLAREQAWSWAAVRRGKEQQLA